MKTSDFDYFLPDELIAQAPAEPRDSCKLMVLDKTSGVIEHRIFRDIGEYLNPGDLLVANETRVRPARLLGHRAITGGKAEVFLLEPRRDLNPSGTVWECLVKPGRRLKPGAVVEFHSQNTSQVVMTATIEEFGPGKGTRIVRLAPLETASLDDAIHQIGAVPLPPYITDYQGDSELYQTVYARREGSAAAPTAGLHFTPELLAQLSEKGVGFETVELKVGLDTFRVVDEEDFTQHQMHTETYSVPQKTVDAINRTHAQGGRVIAVGTTSVRSLESAWDEEAGKLVAQQDATTQLFITPGSTFHVVDALITNFHVPRSTLLMLVSAFAGYDHIMNAYKQAIEQHYRLLSFGDAMFIH